MTMRNCALQSNSLSSTLTVFDRADTPSFRASRMLMQIFLLDELMNLGPSINSRRTPFFPTFRVSFAIGNTLIVKRPIPVLLGRHLRVTTSGYLVIS